MTEAPPSAVPTPNSPPYNANITPPVKACWDIGEIVSLRLLCDRIGTPTQALFAILSSPYLMLRVYNEYLHVTL